MSVRHRCHPTKSSLFPILQAYKPYTDSVPTNRVTHSILGLVSYNNVICEISGEAGIPNWQSSSDRQMPHAPCKVSTALRKSYIKYVNVDVVYQKKMYNFHQLTKMKNCCCQTSSIPLKTGRVPQPFAYEWGPHSAGL